MSLQYWNGRFDTLQLASIRLIVCCWDSAIILIVSDHNVQHATFWPWRSSSGTKLFCTWQRPSWSKRCTIAIYSWLICVSVCETNWECITSWPVVVCHTCHSPSLWLPLANMWALGMLGRSYTYVRTCITSQATCTYVVCLHGAVCTLVYVRTFTFTYKYVHTPLLYLYACMWTPVQVYVYSCVSVFIRSCVDV